MKHTSILFVITSVHNADAASGLARDLAFNTKYLGITLANGGPGFETLTLIIPPWAMHTLGNPDSN